jgi:NAD(P)-dependent dehydrogenase (short-subunit alcohol dehydrogenase family)
MQPFARVVLVTGASRGIGAEVARQLASPDTHVIVNYREKVDRANAVVEAIRSAGGNATALAADISDDVEVEAMMQYITTHFGKLDALILNASGGLEMRRNREAQRQLASLAMPLMPVSARIVYVTSHQAHFYPNKAVPKGYSGVAASKRAGETALYTMRSELDHAGIHVTVVSGDGASIVPAEQFANAIVNAAVTPSPSTIVYIGGADYLMTVS